jgi:hypothetical protein
MSQKQLLGIIGIMAVVLAYVYGASIFTILFIASMAFFQNVAYGLQSRARLRNSNLYHVIAMLVASFVFFATFRYLIRNNLPMLLLPAYIIGCVYGSLKGNKLSEFIEKKIGANVGSVTEKNSNQLLNFWPSLVILILMVVGQALMGDYSIKIVLLIAGLAVLDNFGFSLTTVTRNANNYSIHYIATILQTIIKFAVLRVLVDEQMTWYLLLPQTCGGAMGSILGAESAKRIVKKFKASFEGTLTANGKLYIPATELIVTVLFILPQLLIFGMNALSAVMVLLLAATAQSISFTTVSRARQRKHENYLLWASVFSNGVWYVTAHLLVVNALPNYLLIPYVMGTLFGGMTGQLVSMIVETKLNIKMQEKIA